MIDWAKVVACFHRVVHFDHISMARHRRTYPPKYQPPSFGTELLEPRLLLSGTGLLSETVVPGDTMPVVSVAITAGRLSGEVSPEHLVMHLKLDDITGEIAAGHMFLSDQGHNRVLGWKDLDDALSGNAPDVILGAEGYDDVMPNIGVDSLFWAGDLCFDGNRLWVGEYKFSGRVVGFPLQ